MISSRPGFDNKASLANHKQKLPPPVTMIAGVGHAASNLRAGAK
jgi:hypothetical protein